MTHFRPKTGKRFARWLVLPLALLALFIWSGSVLAAQRTDHPKPDPGVLIAGVGEDSPAAEAGIARGDVLLAIDGDAVNTAAELRHVILMREPDDTVELTVRHGDEERTLTITLGDRDGQPLLGVTTRTTWAGHHRPFGMRGRGGFVGPQGFGGRFKEGQRMPFFKMADGAMILGVQEDSPAAAAGLQKGDVITAVDGIEVAGFDDLAAALAEYSPGDEAQVMVDRDGEAVTVAVTLGAHPDDEEKAFLGARIVPMEHFRFHGFEGQRMPFFKMADGAMILGVREDSPAATAGLQKGDVITAVDGMEVAGFDDLAAALAEYSPGDEAQVMVDRDGEAVTVAVTLGAHPDDEEKAFLGARIVSSRMERDAQGRSGVNRFGFRIPNEFRFFRFSRDSDGAFEMPRFWIPVDPEMQDDDRPAPVPNTQKI